MHYREPQQYRSRHQHNMKSGHGHQHVSSGGGQGLKIAIKRNILHSGAGSYGGPTSSKHHMLANGPMSDVRGSASKKISIQHMDLDDSVVSDRGPAMHHRTTAPSLSTFSKEQA